MKENRNTSTLVIEIVYLSLNILDSDNPKYRVNQKNKFEDYKSEIITSKSSLYFMNMKTT